MICPCGKNVLYLVSGQCKECNDENPKPQTQAPRDKKKMGRPVGDAPYDKKTYNSAYYAKNKEKVREYNRVYKLTHRGSERGQFIIRSGVQYVQRSNRNKFGARSTAKVYSSLAYARQGAARIEGALIEKKDSVI
jgi:hypothetical protein